jgi:PKD repeat protein
MSSFACLAHKAASVIAITSLAVTTPLVTTLVVASAGSTAAPRVPSAGTLTAQRVVSSTPHQISARPAIHPLRVSNPEQYAQKKAAADRAYRLWVAQHPTQALGTPAASIISLNKPGMTAIDGGGGTPPDTTGAIGPNFYVEFVNSAIGVYNRSTLASPPVASQPEDMFTLSVSTCDGQIKWDQKAQRWLYWSLDCGATAGFQGWSFGWSKSSLPTDLTNGWCKYHVNSGSNLDDYGKLGNDDGFTIAGVNEFPNDGASPSVPAVFAIPKPAAGSTTCPSSLAFYKFLPSVANAYTPEPVNIFGSSAVGFVAAVNPTSMKALRLYRLVGSPPAAPTLFDDGDITVPAFSVPASVPQPAPAPATDVLDSSDTRLTQANAVIDPAIGALGIWTQHTVAGSGGGPSVVRWYELKDGLHSPVQSGTIAATGGSFVFNAAISPTIQGNAAAINYNVGGSSILVQLRAQIHAPGASPGTMSNETTLASSSGVDNDFSCPSQTGGARPCRWGDYAGASFDPNNGRAVWGTGMFNGTPDGFGSAQWLTQNFSLLLPDEPPTAAFKVTTPSPHHGTPVAFDGSASKDPDGTITTYSWNFGDTTSGSGAKPSHTYTKAGTFTVTLTVTDSSGLKATVSHKVVVS